ncbi:hypothetical protein ACJX0J_033059 [Zea mays]
MTQFLLAVLKACLIQLRVELSAIKNILKKKHVNGLILSISLLTKLKAGSKRESGCFMKNISSPTCLPSLLSLDNLDIQILKHLTPLFVSSSFFLGFDIPQPNSCHIAQSHLVQYAITRDHMFFRYFMNPTEAFGTSIDTLSIDA